MDRKVYVLRTKYTIAPIGIFDSEKALEEGKAEFRRLMKMEFPEESFVVDEYTLNKVF